MAIHNLILYNGRIILATEAFGRAGQVGLLSGWGVFSTLRMMQGIPFAFDRHWHRMSKDAARLNVKLPANPWQVEEDLRRLAAANRAPASTLRLAVVRNSGGMWTGPGTTGESDLVAMTADSKDWGDSARLMVQPNGRFAAGEFAGAKILSWAHNLTWAERASLDGFDEAILLNEHGRVSECTSANIFAIYGNDVLTPPLSDGCLPGITREVLLGEIQVPGVRVLERGLTLEDLYLADEVCITSTTRDLLAVREIAGRGLTRRGDVQERLTLAFREFSATWIAARQTELQATQQTTGA
jgi:branched-chain amino acid aminotransferase